PARRQFWAFKTLHGLPQQGPDATNVPPTRI
ncbi:uncharacterized protein METZ01_LOCUS299627, partial [marine metagenome]